MNALVITRGLPSTGKTTFARAFVDQDPESRVRVNRDDLRKTMFGVYWGLSYQQEQTVTAAQHAAVRALLSAGKTVVVDDTNLRAKHATAWANLAAELGVLFKLVDIEVDVEQAVQWDRERQERGERAVGEDVIRDFAKRYRGPLPEIAAAELTGSVYVPDETLPDAWLVDLDGTLALMGDRSPFQWDSVGGDALNDPVAFLVEALQRRAEIVVVSGRDAVCRPQTEAWLHKHRIPWSDLFMRPEHDRRKDSIVKEEIFWRDVAPRYAVRGVLDDRDQVVQMWRRIGLFCAQVAPGNF